MSTHKPDQHRLTLNGRVLHFVAYEGTPANERRKEPAVPAMWYLMSEGKRHPVMIHVAHQPLPELEEALRHWAEEYACGPVPPPVARGRLRRATAELRRDDWWAPN